MNSVRLSTHCDLDGIGCAVLAKMFFDDVKVSYCNYDNIDDEITSFLSRTSGDVDSITYYNAIYITGHIS